MKTFLSVALSVASLLSSLSLAAETKPIPEDIQKVMQQSKYQHATWGLYAKDLTSGEVLYDLNYDKMFSPASTSKLFSVAALLSALGDDYRFKTPVYADGTVTDGILKGNLILVAQGDLVFGGRQSEKDKISFTALDHVNANEVPGVTLTKEDPLTGFNELAKQIAQSGIKEINGDVVIDNALFETTEKRNITLSPMFINENLIDLVVNPTVEGELAKITWRPQVPGYAINNNVKTIAKGGALAIEATFDDSGHTIRVQGTIPVDNKDIVRTLPIKDPQAFAQAAFAQALKNQGIKITPPTSGSEQQRPSSYTELHPVAELVSPPLSEYAKLILKVSHNIGADSIPLLLAAHKGKKTFDEGMRMIGDFLINDVKLPEDSFVFIDAAGGNENRLTPLDEIQLLTFINKLPKAQFQHFYDALPILGVDGSLEDFAKKSAGAGKVRAKPGTGVAFNLATGKFFLITQALGGYIEGKNGHLWAYMLAVNNGTMPAIDDIFAIFEDVSQISSMIYEHTD